MKDNLPRTNNVLEVLAQSVCKDAVGSSSAATARCNIAKLALNHGHHVAGR